MRGRNPVADAATDDDRRSGAGGSRRRHRPSARARPGPGRPPGPGGDRARSRSGFRLAPGDRALVAPGEAIVAGTPIAERLRDARLSTSSRWLRRGRARPGQRWSAERPAAPPLPGADGASSSFDHGGRWSVAGGRARRGDRVPVAGRRPRGPARDRHPRPGRRAGRSSASRPSATRRSGRLSLGGERGDAAHGGLRSTSHVGLAGTILVVGARIDAEALTRARAMGVRGVIVAALAGKERRDFLASEARQRAALHRLPPFAVLVLDGAIRRPIASPVAAILEALVGTTVAIVGRSAGARLRRPRASRSQPAGRTSSASGPARTPARRAAGPASPGSRRFAGGVLLEAGRVRFGDGPPDRGARSATSSGSSEWPAGVAGGVAARRPPATAGARRDPTGRHASPSESGSPAWPRPGDLVCLWGDLGAGKTQSREGLRRRARRRRHRQLADFILMAEYARPPAAVPPRPVPARRRRRRPRGRPRRRAPGRGRHAHRVARPARRRPAGGPARRPDRRHRRRAADDRACAARPSRRYLGRCRRGRLGDAAARPRDERRRGSSRIDTATSRVVVAAGHARTARSRRVDLAGRLPPRRGSSCRRSGGCSASTACGARRPGGRHRRAPDRAPSPGLRVGHRHRQGARPRARASRSSACRRRRRCSRRRGRRRGRSLLLLPAGPARPRCSSRDGEARRAPARRHRAGAAAADDGLVAVDLAAARPADGARARRGGPRGRSPRRSSRLGARAARGRRRATTSRRSCPST